MDSTLQIVISAVDEASGILATVSDQLAELSVAGADSAAGLDVGSEAATTYGDMLTKLAVEAGTAVPEIASIGPASEEAAAGTEAATGAVDGLFGSIVKMAPQLLALFGIYEGGKAFLSETIQNTNQYQASNAQLAATVKNTNDAIGLSVSQLDDLAESTSKNTTISQLGNLTIEQTLLGYNAINQNVLPQSIQLVDDLATRMAKGAVPTTQQLSTASRALGKALEDPATGVNAFTRAYVTFSPAQQQAIKDLQKAGDTAGAQALIMKDLAGVVGGDATAATNTFAGRMQELKNQLEPLQIQLGTFADKTLTNLGQGFANVLPAIETIGSQVLNFLAPSFVALYNAVSKIGPIFELTGQLLAPIAQILGVALVGAISLLVQWWTTLLTIGEKVSTWLLAHQAALDAVKIAFIGLAAILLTISQPWIALAAAIGLVWAALEYLQQKFGTFSGVLHDIEPALEAIAKILGTALIDSIEGVEKFFESWFKDLQTGNPIVVGITIVLGSLALIIGGVAAALAIANLAVAAWAVITGIAATASMVFAVAMAVVTDPLFLIALAIGVVIAIVYELITHWKDVKQWGMDAWNGIKGAWDAAGGFFTKIGGDIGGAFDKAWKSTKDASDVAWKGISGAAKAVWMPIYTTVVKPVIDAIVAYLRWLLSVYTYIFDVMRAIAVIVWNFLYANVIKPTIDLIIAYFNLMWTTWVDIWDAIVLALKVTWDFIYTNIIKPVIDLIIAAWNYLIDGLIAEWNDFVGILTAAWHALVAIFTVIWGALRTPIQDTWNFLVGVWGGAVKWFQGIWDGITKGATGVGNGISSAFQGAMNLATAVVKSAANGIIDLINLMIRGINDTAGKLPGVPKLAPIPKLATGTPYFTGGAALVGENGPEYVTMPTGSTVTPAAQTSQLLQGSQTHYHLNVNVGTYAGQPGEISNIATTIWQALQRTARQHGLADQLPNIGILPQ